MMGKKLKREDPVHLEPEEWIQELYLPAGPLRRELFEEQAGYMKVSDKDIALLVPESLGCTRRLPNGNLIFGVGRRGPRARTYDLIIFPATIEMRGRDEAAVMRHELAHVRFGDLDRRLPCCLRKLYTTFVEEPRASLYG